MMGTVGVGSFGSVVDWFRDFRVQILLISSMMSLPMIPLRPSRAKPYDRPLSFLQQMLPWFFSATSVPLSSASYCPTRELSQGLYGRPRFGLHGAL